MKSFSKRMLSFSMAAVMVLSTAVVSSVDASAASSVKMSTASSKVTAGTKYDIKIKGLTKK